MRHKMNKKWDKFRYPLWLLAILLLAWYGFFGYKYRFNYNWGTSMMPTLEHTEWIIVQKRYSLGEDWVPEKWDVLIIIDKKNRESLCKRVVATSGDVVEIRDGFILVNGEKLKNPFLSRPPQQTKPNHDEHPYKVKKGEVWVIGDNVPESWYGPLPIKDIDALVVIW